MTRWCRIVPVAFLILAQLVFAGCGSGAAPAPGGQAPAAQRPAGGATSAPAGAGSPAAGVAAGLPQVTAAAAPAGQPKPGGTFRLAMLGDATMNPFTWPGQLPTTLAAKPLYDTLTKFDTKDLSPAPDLATEWKSVEGGKGWDFKLRQGVKWHDGQPFSAEDVKFTLEAIVDPKNNALFRSQLAGVTGVDILDPATIRIKTETPIPSLPTILAYNIAIAPKHLLEGKNLSEIPDYVQRPIGTGPFKFKENVKGDRFVLEANPDYFEGRPYLDQFVFKVVPDINQVVAQLRTGELDLAMIEPENKNALRQAQNLTFLTVQEPNTFYVFINNSRPLFQDKRVRQALAYGLDRETIVKQILQGEAPVAGSVLASVFGPYYNDLKPYPYDPERAKALLEEAGWQAGPDGVRVKDGQRLAFSFMVDKGNPTREQIATAVQQYWKRLGADVSVDIQEWSVYLERGNRRPGDYDTRSGWRITSPDPDKLAEFGTGGSVNHFAYSNAEVDQLLKAGREEFDLTKRAEIYKRFQQIVYDDVPVIPLYYVTEIIALNKRVQGFPPIGIRDALTYMHKVWVTQ